MKKRLNMLCILVVIVLLYSVAQSLYLFGLGVSFGMRTVKSTELHKEEQLNSLMNLQAVGLIPDGPTLFNDSVYNEKSQSYVPAFYGQLGVGVPTKPNIWQKFLSMFCNFIHLLALLGATVLFIRTITSINKSNIFSWKNVSRLRWLGGLLILSFISSFISAFVSYRVMIDSFSLQGYRLHIFDFISILTLVLGIVSYIVAEIFAIGLKMKEEQELTI